MDESDTDERNGGRRILVHVVSASAQTKTDEHANHERGRQVLGGENDGDVGKEGAWMDAVVRKA